MSDHIAFVIHSLSAGGAERVVSTLANHLFPEYKITIITFSKQTPYYTIKPGINLIHCEKPKRIFPKLISPIVNNYKLYYQLTKIFKNQNISLAISFMTSANVLTTWAAKRCKIPVIISERIDPRKSYTTRIWHFLRSKTYSLANLLVVQTQPIKQFFLWMGPKKVIILPNPLSPELKRKPNREHSKIILNVGRLTEQKGQDVLIRAYAALNPAGWELHFVGDGSLKNAYQDLIDSLDMQHNIKLLGRSPDVSHHYNKAAIFVFPSRFEGFPNALTEAMYMGLPVIAADCPTGPSELIETGQNGYLIPVDDEIALKQNLKKLIDDPNLRDQLGKKAHLSTKKFQTDHVVDQWREQINLLLTQSCPL